jgi:hypothetical protein
MTRAEFETKFRLLNRVTEDGVRTYHAMAASGAVVMVHFLGTEEGPARSEVLSRLEALEAEKKSRVLRIAEIEDEPVVVTKFILDFESLERWLGIGAEASMPPEVVARDPTAGGSATPPPTAEPGEFTKMFQAPVPGVPPTRDPVAAPRPSAAEPAPPPEPRPLAAPPAPVDDEPGEFTRLFQSPLGAPEPAPAEPAPAEPAPGKAAEPVETPETPSLAADAATASEPPHETNPGASADAPPAPPALEPGEFTHMFRAPTQPPPQEPGAPPPNPPPGSEPGSAEGQAGEFTRLFQAAARPPEPPTGPYPSADRGPRPESPPQSPQNRAPAPPPAADPVEPGEFTREMQGVPRSPEPPRPPAVPDESLAALRQPDERRVDLPSASPSLPGLNLHRGPSPVSPPAPGNGESDAPPPPPALGEFTMMFGSAREPGGPHAANPSGPASPAPPATPPPSVPGPPGFPAPSAAPAGEYTRMISAQKAPPTPPPPPKAQPAPAPQSGSPPAPAPPPPGAPRGLIIGLILIIVVMAGLLLYLILDRRSDPSPPPAEESAETTAPVP